jgi:hypothetical protein
MLGMFGVLGKILGSGDMVKQGMDLIDSVHTSDEEMVKAKAQAKIDTMNAYAPFKVAQRYLALMFAFTFLVSFFLVLVMSLMGRTDIDVVRDVVSEFWIGEIMITIVGFYFGGGMLEGVAGKMKGKKES